MMDSNRLMVYMGGRGAGGYKKTFMESVEVLQ